jgi:hypothetical protein
LPRSVDVGSVVLFEPRLPARESCRPDEWGRIVARYDERWREWWGPVGDEIRARAAAKEVSLDPVTGVIRTSSPEGDRVLREGSPRDPSLPRRLAFVVELAAPRVGRGQFAGRVRHLVSARSTHFGSSDECLEFIGGVVGEGSGDEEGSQ